MKTLRYFFIAALAMMVGNVTAQEVTLDFTTNSWNLPEGSASKATAEAQFSNGTYSITLSAADGYYFNTQGYLMLGKAGSSLTLPAFSFDVEQIQVVGRSGASGSVVQNIFVGDNAVSTETTGATGTNTYVIAEGKQAAGTIYTLKVTSAHNTQITKILIYKKGAAPEPPTIQEITVAKALEIIGALDDGATTAEQYKVSGYVVGDPDFQRNAETSALYGNVNLTIADAAGGSPLLTVYRAKNIGNVNFTEETIGTIKAGYQVVFQGQLQKYVKDNLSTPELKNGFLVSVTAGGGETGLETVWDFTILPTQKIDGTGNIIFSAVENAGDGYFIEGNEDVNWQAFYNAGAITGEEFTAKSGEPLEMTKHLKWYINGEKKVYYRNYPASNQGGRYIFINDGDNATELEIPAAVGQQIELIASTAKNNKKVTSEDVAETFDDGEGNPVHGVIIDGTTKFDWKPYTLTVTTANPFLKFEKNMCIQKITVKDGGGTGIAAVKTANKVANNVMYNLAGQKVGKDFKGIVIVNGKKMLNK